MDVSPQQIRWILIQLFILVASVAFHEFGHAIMADKLGDDTPRRQGRVTLNPLAHADPIGTLALPLFGAIATLHGGGGGGFGWGRPVQWQPSRINRKWRMTTAQILVAIAGPGMNVLLAVIVALVHVVLLSQNVVSPASEVNQILVFAVTTNFILFFFNLVPAPPLDGGHVAEGLMPYRKRQAYEAYAKYGPFVVLAIAAIPQLAQIFRIPANFCALHLYRGLGALFGM